MNGMLRESANFSVTLNDYFVHTCAVSENLDEGGTTLEEVSI